MQVVRTSVTPVKGTRLHHPDEIEIGASGVVGNRRFFFIDAEGTKYNASRLGPLMSVRAKMDGGSLTFTFPDRLMLSASVLAEGDVMEIDMWGRTCPVRRIRGPWDEAISRIVGQPVRLVEPMEPGDGNDDAPITLVSLASVARLSTEAGVDDVDPDRFRMTLDIDGVEAHQEDSWTGRQIGIGSAVLRVGDQVPRCLLTTWNPRSGARDLDTLKLIRNYRGRSSTGIPFGMYASVVRPGVVRVGDDIRSIDEL